MSNFTPLLTAIQQGDPQAANRLLPLVYDELRKLASAKLRHEKPGQTLSTTDLVHEAYLRLIGDQNFANRRHFYAAAAKAMQRILIDRARRRQTRKRGGDAQHQDVDLDQLHARYADSELVDIHSLLDDLAKVDPESAELVLQHVFGGLSLEEAGALLDMSRATAYRNWAFARAWLRHALTFAGKTAPP